VENIQDSLKSDKKITGTSNEDKYIFPIKSRLIILRMRNVSGKINRKKNLFPENRALYEIMWKNIVEPDRPPMKIWRKRLACWIPKAKNTHSEYVMLIHFKRL